MKFSFKFTGTLSLLLKRKHPMCARFFSWKLGLISYSIQLLKWVYHVQLLAFPKSWRSISLNTDRYLHTACFVLWIIRLLIKFQIRLLALGFEPRHTSRCLHIITWGCSANWTILTCQNLSFLRKVCKIWNETLSQLVSFSLLNRFALKKGPPLYVKVVILPIS